MNKETVVLTPEDTHYPKALLGDENGPLYILGNQSILNTKAIAIVGTRTPTEYGKRMAKWFSESLASVGYTIISGLARGIDAEAHKGALGVKGNTIAVLGNGFDYIYPPEHKSLSDAIISKGCLVTCFEDETKPLPQNFLARNRIIASLSIGVLIIEGGAKSGTLNTASHAGDMNRPVFAVPGPLDSPMSVVPHYLIRHGATLVTHPENIIEAIRNQEM